MKRQDVDDELREWLKEWWSGKHVQYDFPRQKRVLEQFERALEEVYEEICKGANRPLEEAVRDNVFAAAKTLWGEMGVTAVKTADDVVITIWPGHSSGDWPLAKDFLLSELLEEE